MTALRGMVPAAATSRGGLSRLLPMIGTRGIDQFALGVASLLIARRTGTEAFAPFATIFILYALTAQVGDTGLAFAILRTRVGQPISSRSWIVRMVANAVVAVVAVAIGLAIGGAVGVVVGFGGLALLTGPAVFVGRASLQRSGETRRLSVGEAVGALAFLVTTVVVVHDADDLLAFAAICIAKHLIELSVQQWPAGVFAPSGMPIRAQGVWVSQLVTYATANIDYLIVGALLGEVALSIYAIGFRLASAFPSVVSSPLTRTTFVDFANTDDAQRQHDRLVKQIALFGVVGVLLTGAVAMVLPSILGPGWEETRRVTAILGLALPWRLLLGPVVALGLTNGAARRVIGWELVRMGTLTAAIVIGSASILGVSIAVAAATILSIGWAYRRACSGAGIRSSTTLEVVGLVAALTVVLLGFVL